MSRVTNNNLNKALDKKDDEFYTPYETIENELEYYKEELKGKKILMNCDIDKSEFWNYFKNNFHKLGLKKIVATGISDNPKVLTYDGVEVKIEQHDTTGKFDSEHSKRLLDESDVVITNPPFSLFREFIDLIKEYDKDFLIIGSNSATTYANFFPLIRDGKVSLGKHSSIDFYTPTGEVKKVRTYWYTTLKHTGMGKKLPNNVEYNEELHKTFDNYDAINIAKMKDFPKGYNGVMGLPITYLEYHDPTQYRIVGSNRGRGQDPTGYYGRSSYLNGKETFKRIFIKRLDK